MRKLGAADAMAHRSETTDNEPIDDSEITLFEDGLIETIEYYKNLVLA